jgi:hypothetical protein
VMMEQTYRKLLEKILESNEFSHSKIYQTYLTYLVESSLSNKELKETTIAIEVFGKDARFNPAEDTIVRSHTYTLRKKLESYYFHEGKDDKYVLKFNRGHYHVQFVLASEKPYHPKQLFKLTKKNGFILSVVFLIIVIALLLWRNHALENRLLTYQPVKMDDPFWKEYLQSKMPILIVLGDHFFFNEFSEKYQTLITIRHPKINSIEDYRSLYPKSILESSSEPYFPYHSIWSLPPVLSILFAGNKPFFLRKSSDINTQILDEYNIIFLGSIKTLYNLKHTLSKSHFQFEIAPHKVIFTPSDSSTKRIFETKLHSSGPNEDLVLACKLPGPNNNSIFIIASYHSLGAPTIASYFASPALRLNLEQKFIEKYQSIPPYFEVLFRVTGIDKIPYSTEILIFNKITSDY